jgi:hypothetical protein
MAKNSERKENASSTVSDSTKSIAEKTFDFAAYRQEVLSNPKANAAMEIFEKYRHREWEGGLTRN